MERDVYLEVNRKIRYCKGHKIVLSDMDYVWYDGMKCEPRGYLLDFDKDGNPTHSAVLVDVATGTGLQVRLEDVKYDQNTGV